MVMSGDVPSLRWRLNSYPDAGTRRVRIRVGAAELTLFG